jgi:tRNA threonylcarbamoyladenosine biosynthesis protein TsaE
MSILSHSITQTQGIAQNLAQEVLEGSKPRLILLNGELGGGKTTFSQGFLKALGITQTVNSPTFVIMKPYIIPDSEYTVYHFDLYRLEQEWEVLELGINDILQNPQSILLIEWANKTPHLWENIPHIQITFNVISPEERSIIIQS